jgi:hypothetical protein
MFFPLQEMAGEISGSHGSKHEHDRQPSQILHRIYILKVHGNLLFIKHVKSDSQTCFVVVSYISLYTSLDISSANTSDFSSSDSDYEKSDGDGSPY